MNALYLRVQWESVQAIPIDLLITVFFSILLFNLNEKNVDRPM